MRQLECVHYVDIIINLGLRNWLQKFVVKVHIIIAIIVRFQSFNISANNICRLPNSSCNFSKVQLNFIIHNANNIVSYRVSLFVPLISLPYLGKTVFLDGNNRIFFLGFTNVAFGLSIPKIIKYLVWDTFPYLLAFHMLCLTYIFIFLFTAVKKKKKNSHFLYLDPPHFLYFFIFLFQILFLLKIMSITIHSWENGHSISTNICEVEE